MKNQKLPKVVALMPAWNAEHFILPVLEALATQTYANLQVLISDDASTDNTARICTDFAATRETFHVIRQPRNIGWIGNVNALLRSAEGTYFFFAFHDDIPRPTYVERLVEALEGNPQAVIAFSDMVRRREGSPATDEDVKTYRDLDGVDDAVQRGIRVARYWGEPPSYVVTLANRGLFRSDAARDVGGLRRHIAGEFGADWPWLLHLALLGEFVRVPEALIEKYYRPTSLSASWNYSVWQRLGVLISCMRETRRARLAITDEIKIHKALGNFFLRRTWWEFRTTALQNVPWRTYRQ